MRMTTSPMGMTTSQMGMTIPEEDAYFWNGCLR